MEKIMSADANEDIRMTRSQVSACFQRVQGFFLPYPGEMVSESDTYSGDIGEIRPLFKVMVEEYLRQLFAKKLNVKVIHGREVRALHFDTLVAVSTALLLFAVDLVSYLCCCCLSQVTATELHHFFVAYARSFSEVRSVGMWLVRVG